VPYFPRLNLNPRWHQYARVPSWERIAGLEVYHPRYFITPRVGMVSYGLMYFLSLYRFMRKLSREYPFDILDAHYIYPDGLAAVLLARVLKKPVVLSARGSDINMYMRFPLIRAWILYALHRCDGIIAVSAALKTVMVRAGVDEKKITVIPNGVDAHIFRFMPKDQARRELDLPQQAHLILSVGSLRPSKGFQHLLRALQQIRMSSPGRRLELVIVGYGHYRSQLEREIDRLGLSDVIRLAGRVVHEQMFKWYSACDLFCLASSSEGWPNVLCEALACGLPVVATRVGGVPEIITSPDYGLMLDTVSEDQLAGQLQLALQEALDRSWDRQKMIAYAQGHTWEAVAGKVAAVFRQVLDGTS